MCVHACALCVETQPVTFAQANMYLSACVCVCEFVPSAFAVLLMY